MAILQLIAEEEKSLCFDFLEEKIREESRKLIESIYADEVNQFLGEWIYEQTSSYSEVELTQTFTWNFRSDGICTYTVST